MWFPSVQELLSGTGIRLNAIESKLSHSVLLAFVQIEQNHHGVILVVDLSVWNGGEIHVSFRAIHVTKFLQPNSHEFDVKEFSIRDRNGCSQRLSVEDGVAPESDAACAIELPFVDFNRDLCMPMLTCTGHLSPLGVLDLSLEVPALLKRIS